MDRQHNCQLSAVEELQAPNMLCSTQDYSSTVSSTNEYHTLLLSKYPQKSLELRKSACIEIRGDYSQRLSGAMGGVFLSRT